MMEEDGEETPRTPFWIQSTTNLRRGELYRRRASSLFFNSGVLIILLLLFAIISMVYIIPSLISFSSQIFRPNLVKKSWDSINLVLVLFALAFGFLGRNINNDQKSRFDNGFDRSSSDFSTAPTVSTPPPIIQHQWYDFPEQPIGGLRRHRSTSSYPDLRELSPPWNHQGAGSWRFSDDTHLNSHRSLDSDRYYFRREQDPDTKDVIHVDSVVDLPKEDSYAPPPPPSPPPPASKDESYSPPQQLPSPPSLPPQPQPPAMGRKNLSRTYHNAAEYAGEKSRSSEFSEVFSPETAPPPPPVTVRSLPPFQDSDRKGETNIRKRGKGERRRARSSEPRKMVTPEPSSPPPILPIIQDSDQKTGGVERKRTVPPFVTEKPRVPLNMSFINTIDDSSSGGESPMGRIPPPPPMPPFKMPDWKFAVEGNYVRVQSTLSSGSVSPDGDEAQSPLSAVASPLFCPSPDVDTKADSFIARFRAGLKLEKINSFNQNQGLRMSNLGPGPGPSDHRGL
ncbi:Protein of unknown function DUF761, plant [Cynara cardunculus var. scolymus]|uniref:Hydroxyproline-rich glycoprotein family protein n=1 Tax=Cynara cardunculus var. scolymus TaxID=59895 RepID=A0A103XLF7_CYNCS|nr:Protein of unknown function DUF761, plant [Cynara cardunculus var. scolymus]